MKFLVDTHLPPSLCAVLVRHGHDANHTLDLPAKNATKDTFLNQISIDEQRVVISKDSDFFYSHLVLGRPWKLACQTAPAQSRSLATALPAFPG